MLCSILFSYASAMTLPQLLPYPAYRQSGAALLLLLCLLTLGSLAWLLQEVAYFDVSAQRNQVTDRALLEAREALLGYAAAYPEQHLKGEPSRAAFVTGHLPCPDTGNALGNEGAEAGTCGAKGVTVIGHFPWRSLGIPPPRDGHGECLWYAVSGHYKANPKADLLNPDIPGQFQIFNAEGDVVAGATAQERPVAVLFSPGAPLEGQDRQHNGGECSGNYDARQFLEEMNGINNSAPNSAAEGITRLITAQSGPSFNDRLLWIGREDLFERRIARRLQFRRALFDEQYADTSVALTQRVAACLARLGEHNAWHRLPWAAPLSLTAAAPDTFDNTRFADKTGLYAGRPPFSVGNSQKILNSTLGNLPGCPAANVTHSSCRLLRSDSCPEFLPAAGYPTPADGGTYVGSDNGWWDKWKDHLFYVLAPGFAPAEAAAVDCDLEPEHCLTVNGKPYAAALIFAGAPLHGQFRDESADRLVAQHYLEGQNAITLREGGHALEVAGNDQIACIKGPTAASPGFTLVPNCGNLECKTQADILLARINGKQNLCRQGNGPTPECLAAQEQLVGCACRGEAEIFLEADCLASLDAPACQAAVSGLKTCV
jgi:hypothetical protein